MSDSEVEVDDDREWVSFSIMAGREGDGASLIEGRGRRLNEALRDACRKMATEWERFGYRDAYLIWRNGDLAAVVSPPTVPDGPLFVLRFDYADPDPSALDEACAAYLAARTALDEASSVGSEAVMSCRAEMNEHRRTVTRLAFEAVGHEDPTPLDCDRVPVWEPFGVETDRFLVYLEPYADPDGNDRDYSDTLFQVIPRATIVRLIDPATTTDGAA